MKMNQILDTIDMLAQSQGFYGRLLYSILELKDTDPYRYDMVVEELEGQNFKDTLDLVFYFEC